MGADVELADGEWAEITDSFRERLAAFERGLADGGYEGAQLAIADLLAERYELAKGMPEAGSRRVYLPVAIAWRYIDGGDFQRAIDWLEEAFDGCLYKEVKRL